MRKMVPLLTRITELIKEYFLSVQTSKIVLYYFNVVALYEGMGTMTFKGKTMDVMATMNPVCDKEKWTCETKWTFKNKKCPQTCTADMTIDYAQKNRLQITTQYGGDKEMTNEVKVENGGKRLHIINTWNKVGCLK